jgi:hypothetical protein
MVLGPIIGGLAGKAISWIFGSTKVKSELDKARDELSASIEKEKKKRENLESILEIASTKQSAQDRVRQSSNNILKAMEETALKQKGKMLTLNEQEVEMIKSRATQFTMFGKGTKETTEILDKLKTGGQISAAELHILVGKTKDYETGLGNLRDVTQKQYDLEIDRLRISNVGQQKEALEMTTKLHDMELKAAKEKLKDMGGGLDLDKGQGWFGARRVHTFDEKMEQLKGLSVEWDKELRKNNLAPERKKWLESMKEHTAKQIAQGELEAKINKLELQNTKDKKDLVQSEAAYFKQETILGLQKAIQSETGFMEFQKSGDVVGKTIEQQMLAYLESGKSNLSRAAGVRELIAEGLNFNDIAKPKETTVAEPIAGGFSSGFNAPPSLQFQPTNFANSSQAPAANQSSSTIIIHNSVTLDSVDVMNGFAAGPVRLK